MLLKSPQIGSDLAKVTQQAQKASESNCNFSAVLLVYYKILESERPLKFFCSNFHILKPEENKAQKEVTFPRSHNKWVNFQTDLHGVKKGADSPQKG